MAEPAERAHAPIEPHGRSVGIVPFARIGAEAVAFLQVSISARFGDFKIDPYRGHVEGHESDEEAAARETFEESLHLIDLRPAAATLAACPRDNEGVILFVTITFPVDIIYIAQLEAISAANAIILRALGDRTATQEIDHVKFLVWNAENTDFRNYPRENGTVVDPRLAGQSKNVIRDLTKNPTHVNRFTRNIKLAAFPTVALGRVVDTNGITSFVASAPLAQAAITPDPVAGIVDDLKAAKIKD